MSKPASQFRLVLVTAPDRKTARRLTRAALKARLIACANLVSQIESHYWWKGRLEHGTEVLMLLKTTTTRLDQLEKMILALHPYDTPEFIVLTFTRATPQYLNWILQTVRGKSG